MAPPLPARPVRRRSLFLGAATAAALAGCTSTDTASSGGGSASAASSAPGSATPSTSPSADAGPTPSASASATAASTAAGTTDGISLDGWTLEQKVGQLLVVGVDAGSTTPPGRYVTELHVGGVFLSGRSSRGASATKALVDSLQALVTEDSTHGSRLLISTDQEGGDVQVLSGRGFSTMPTALTQATSGAEALKASATTWGAELASAGVTMNLAPDADLVDIADPTSNAPIGQWKREYGHDAATVTACAGAFAAGMRASGVIPTFKHFPGLGRVTQNTDIASGVTDAVTTHEDAGVGIFRTLIGEGTCAVMASSADYSLIDAGTPACFSSAVITDLLRGDLGFEGVVITDDVAAAVQVSDWTPGDRAVSAVEAGCDIVLAAADASVADAMASALVEAAQADEAFAARVDASVRRVLALKATLG